MNCIFCNFDFQRSSVVWLVGYAAMQLGVSLPIPVSSQLGRSFYWRQQFDLRPLAWLGCKILHVEEENVFLWLQAKFSNGKVSQGLANHHTFSHFFCETFPKWDFHNVSNCCLTNAMSDCFAIDNIKVAPTTAGLLPMLGGRVKPGILSPDCLHLSR